jgi:dUTP pyrophosphatase
MGRKFEKISFEQFCKDINNDKNLYEEYNLPKRHTKYSAGYDFYAIQDFVLKPGEIRKVPTGVKVRMQQDEMLMIIVRSSIGFKYNFRLCNQVGIIESDYYDNPSNEGHIWVALQNHGDREFVVNKGERFVQGIFSKFLIVDDEEDILIERVGGIGSTN